MKFLITIIGLALCWQIGAQIRLVPSYPANPALTPQGLREVRFDNPNGRTIEAVLIAEVRRSGQLVYRSQTRPVLLPGGQQNFNSDLLQEEKTNYFDRDVEASVKRSGHFPAGTYEICLLAKSPRTGGELGRDCRQLSFDQQEVSPAGPAKGIRLSGRANVEYFYTDQAFWGAEGYRQYLRFDLRPRIQWKDIPLGLDIFHTTDDGEITPGMNAVSLYFDAQAFKEQLREKLQSSLAARAARIQQEYALDFEKERQLTEQLAGLSDSSLARYQALVPELEHRLEQYGEKELRYREKQVRERLEAKQQNYLDQRGKLLQKGKESQHQLDSLDAAYTKWQEDQEGLRQQLISLQQQIKELEELKRELTAGKQGLQQFRSLQGRSGFLQNQLQTLQQQNDSLRQLLPQVTDLSDPKALKRHLRSEGLFKKSYSWLLALQEFKLGTYRPRYSPLILSGAQANGMSIQVSPQPAWQFSASVGKLQSLFWSYGGQTGENSNSPMVAAGKVGWRGQGVQTYLLAALPFQAPSQNTTETINGPPDGSLRLGTGLGFELLDQRLTGQLDAAWALRKKQANGSETAGFGPSSAFNFTSQWQLSERMRFSAAWQSVGAAYEDLGSPFLLSGMEQIDLQLEQSLWKNQLSVGIFYLKDKNRPIGFSPFTFENHQYGLQLAWQAEGLPQISSRLGRNLLLDEDNGNHAWLWSFLAHHTYQMGSLQVASQLSFQHTQQQLNTQLAPQLYTFLEVRQQFFWNDLFSTTLSVYQNSGVGNGAIRDIQGADLQLSFNKTAWQVDLTGGLYQQKGLAPDHRLNINIRIPVSKNIRFSIHAGRQPSFINPTAYYLIRTGISGMF